MKKAIFVIVLVLGLIPTACQASSASSVRDGDPVFESIAEGSENVASYSANFCNLGQCWGDQEAIKKPFLGIFLSRPHVHVAYLKDPQSRLVLRAQPGWKWVFRTGQEDGSAWYLEKE